MEIIVGSAIIYKKNDNRIKELISSIKYSVFLFSLTYEKLDTRGQ